MWGGNENENANSSAYLEARMALAVAVLREMAMVSKFGESIAQRVCGGVM